MRKGAAERRSLSEAVLVREWGAEAFHHRVLEFEARGYIARRETYRITPEMNPETGEVIHLHTIEMSPQSAGDPPDSE
jgi:hypothetical protein